MESRYSNICFPPFSVASGEELGGVGLTMQKLDAHRQILLITNSMEIIRCWENKPLGLSAWRDPGWYDERRYRIK